MGILESVPEGGKITYEMTANGMAGYAFEEWTNADSEFAKFFYPWFMNPEYHRPGLEPSDPARLELRCTLRRIMRRLSDAR